VRRLKTLLIDYVAQKYNWDSYSIVRTLFEGLQKAGHHVQLFPVLRPHTKADVVIVASSFIELFPVKKPLVVLGLSDPVHFDKKRMTIADLYVTISSKIADKFKLPWMPPWADSRYFVDKGGGREADCVFLGVGNHPAVPERRKMADQLRAEGLKVLVYGKGWPDHPDNHGHVVGRDLIKAYCSGKVLVDFSNKATSISSRIFQSMMCGTPVLTADRLDVRSLFKVGKEIVTFNEKSLIGATKRMLSLDTSRRIIAAAGHMACVERHDTQHRVKTLLDAIVNKFPRLG